jgi:hypothetical protein
MRKQNRACVGAQISILFLLLMIGLVKPVIKVPEKNVQVTINHIREITITPKI